MVLLLCLFTNCSNSNEDGSSSSDAILPLGVGYSWTYIDSSFNSDGSFHRADSSRLTITGTTSISVKNKSVRVYDWTWFDFEANAYANDKWLITNENGFTLYGVRDTDSTYLWDPDLSFKYPVSANESWTHINYIITMDANDAIEEIEKDTVHTTCSSTASDFRTGIGTLKCHEYSETTDGYEISYFFALNKGLVGMIQKKNNVVLQKKMLRSYSLAANTKTFSVKSGRVSKGSNGINLWGIRK